MSHRQEVISSPVNNRRNGGFIMITGLIFLVILTMLSLSMFRSLGLQERIAGNTRDKQRALEAAQTALQYGEWWLNQGYAAGTGLNCANGDIVNGNDITAMKICSNSLADPRTLPWAARTKYKPPNMAVATGGGLTSSSSITDITDINYQSEPGLFISYVGFNDDGTALLYKISAFGYGGNVDTAAVVQSTYQVKTDGKDLGVL